MIEGTIHPTLDGRGVQARYSTSEECADVWVIQPDGSERIFATYNGGIEAWRCAEAKAISHARAIDVDLRWRR